MLLIGSALLPAAARADEFVKGADVGWLPQMELAHLPFVDQGGQPADCLQILKAHGINTVRLRVFVNPSDDPINGHCSKDEVVAMAVRAKKAGQRVMIDFHYSDTWADPAHQTKPAAWADHSFAQLQDDVYQHTHDVLTAVEAAGVKPEWAQVGNEITDGLLWPDGRSKNDANLAQLINAGYRGVKSVDPKIKVIVHLDRGHQNGLYRWFFDRLDRNGGQYDVIGLSFYPEWAKGDPAKVINDLGENLADCAARYKKEVMVVEIGHDAKDVDRTHDLLVAVLQRVKAVPQDKGLGVLYWEPESRASWSHYRLGCWGEDGRPTRALDAFMQAP